jgi:transketolase
VEKKYLNQIKSLALDMVDEANSGHPGIVLSAMPIIYTLYTRHLKFNPLDPKWLNRDRFILSCGHGSALLYSLLHYVGYDISLEELKRFRKLRSVTPGHPEYGLTPGVEATTGPLGQGIANGVGIALAQRYLNSLTNSLVNEDLMDHYTYVLVSDGDLMEGISYEASSLAGMQKLNKLIVLYDSNDVCLDGDLNKTFTEDVLLRFKSMGWQTILVNDGNNLDEIDRAIKEAKENTTSPTLIEVKTIIGYESINEGSHETHGKPLTKEDLNNLKTKWGLPLDKFNVSEDDLFEFRELFKERIQNEYLKWTDKYLECSSNEELKHIFAVLNKEEKENIPWDEFSYPNEDGELRNYNNLVMNFIADNSKLFIGGSADLASSCKTNLNNFKELNKENPNGKNIWFGVREHAMGAIINGLSLSGLKSFGSTFLTFSDYQKPSLRLNALMDLNSVYIYSHDSVMIGEDGPTHQPIEQLGTLRSIPNVNVFRPFDLNELIGSWKYIMNSDKTSCLIVNKNKTPLFNSLEIEDVKMGAYIISKEQNNLDGIIISSGSEVLFALEIQKELLSENIDLRVVSVPCLDLFETQSEIYKQKILPVGIKKIVIEASNDIGYLKYLTNEKYLININQFGYSGHKDQILETLNFAPKSLTDIVRNLI